MITLDGINEILRPWVGASLLESIQPVCLQVQSLSASPAVLDDPHAFCDRVSVLVYKAVHQATSGRFVVKPDGYEPVKMRAEDFNILADEIMYLVFTQFSSPQEGLRYTQDYALRYPSLSALRALYIDYAPLQTAQELETVRRMIIDYYPAYRYRAWLDS